MSSVLLITGKEIGFELRKSENRFQSIAVGGGGEGMLRKSILKRIGRWSELRSFKTLMLILLGKFLEIPRSIMESRQRGFGEIRVGVFGACNERFKCVISVCRERPLIQVRKLFQFLERAFRSPAAKNLLWLLKSVLR